MNTIQKQAALASGLVLASVMFVGPFSAMADVVLPTVATTPADQITTTSARIMGSLSSFGTGTSVTVDFEYGPTASYGTTSDISVVPEVPAIFGFVIGLGNSASPLTCNTTYHYRAVANSSDGTAYGDDMSFTTLPCPAPTITTTAASAISLTSENLQATYADPTGTGGPMTVGFDYGLTTAYGSTVTSPNPVSAGIVSVLATDLTCGTAYHFRAFGTDASNNTIHGDDMTFTTMPCEAVVTVAATDITATSAVVGGILNQSVLAADAIVVGIKVGTVFAAETQHAVPGPFSYAVSVLTCNTQYSFYAYATDGTTNVSGTTLTFTTLPCAGGGSGGSGGGGGGGSHGGSGGGSGGGSSSGGTGGGSVILNNGGSSTGGTIQTSGTGSTTDTTVTTVATPKTAASTPVTKKKTVATPTQNTTIVAPVPEVPAQAPDEALTPAPLAASAIGSGIFARVSPLTWMLALLILAFIALIGYRKYRENK